MARAQALRRGRSSLLGLSRPRSPKSGVISRFISGISRNDDDTDGCCESIPIISKQQQPYGGVSSHYDILARTAPYAALDPNLSSYFLERVIDYGVPSAFLLAVVGTGAGVAYAVSRVIKKEKPSPEVDNPVSELYSDLYGDQKQRKQDWLTALLADMVGAGSSRDLPKNVGIPFHQYFKVTYLNKKLESYDFSLESNIRSKAAAASVYRNKSLRRALSKALVGGESPLPAIALEKLEKAEQDLLDEGKTLISTIHEGYGALTEYSVDEELKRMGVDSPYDLYPKISAEKKDKGSPEKESRMRSAEIRKKVEKAMALLQQLELKFVREVIQAGGPEHAPLLRTALLGDASTRGSAGSLLLALEERPLKSLLKSLSETPPRVYMTEFWGGLMPNVTALRETVTAIVRHARPGVDEVLVVLHSGGGTVTGYGLAAGQLLRIKNAGIKLTVAVEEVAASGGYMMCCTADRITASPFAALGSIGVVSEMPNIHGRLKREGVEFASVTAGKYKRKLTPFKEITREDLDKTKQDLEDILTMFRDFIAQNRPQINMDEVATGEVWFGTDALARKLCDEIKTVDDVLMDYMDQGYEAYEIEYKPPSTSPLKELSRRARDGGPFVIGWSKFCNHGSDPEWDTMAGTKSNPRNQSPIGPFSDGRDEFSNASGSTSPIQN